MTTLSERFFQLQAHQTTISTEAIAGLTTFLSMSYILFVNPEMLAQTGMNKTAVFMATAIAAAIGSLLIGLLSNYPFAQAPGMGLNAFFTFTVVFGLGYTWQQGLAIVFLSGVLFLILTVTGLRAAIIKAIPYELKMAIAPGIGLFIALIGLNNAGLVSVNQGPIIDIILGSESLEANALISNIQNAPPQIIELGDVRNPAVVLAFIGLLLLTAMMILKVKGAMLWAIVGTTLLGIPLGVTSLPNSYQLSDLDISTTAFQLDFVGLFTPPEGVSQWNAILTLLLVVISFALVDLLDTLGTLLGTASQGDLLDKEGNLPRMNKALLADASATTIGALLGTSSVTTYVESGSGIVAGGRTGLTAVVVALLFLLSIFLAPIAGMVPPAATSPVLIVVGILMFSGIQKIELTNLEKSIPAVLLILLMPFTYSIANGIAFGLLFYVVIQLLLGKARTLHPILYVLVVLFMLRYAFI
jgi:AGZA family xanthine/uracil permease-like MFS transporter